MNIRSSNIPRIKSVDGDGFQFWEPWKLNQTIIQTLKIEENPRRDLRQILQTKLLFSEFYTLELIFLFACIKDSILFLPLFLEVLRLLMYRISGILWMAFFESLLSRHFKPHLSLILPKLDHATKLHCSPTIDSEVLNSRCSFLITFLNFRSSARQERMNPGFSIVNGGLKTGVQRMRNSRRLRPQMETACPRQPNVFAVPRAGWWISYSPWKSGKKFIGCWTPNGKRKTSDWNLSFDSWPMMVRK